MNRRGFFRKMAGAMAMVALAPRLVGFRFEKPTEPLDLTSVLSEVFRRPQRAEIEVWTDSWTAGQIQAAFQSYYKDRSALGECLVHDDGQ